MSDFSALIASVQSYIRQNGNNEITGDILQEVLVGIINTLGTTAINALETGLSTEQTTRANADTALGGRIDTEEGARQQADTALGGRIDGLVGTIGEVSALATTLQSRLDEGYLYKGIATPTTNPSTPTGKVFYIAVQAGTYTYFDEVEVANGITILSWDGEDWSVDVAMQCDLSIWELQAYASKAEAMLVTEDVIGHFIYYDCSIRDNNSFRYRKYEVESGKVYYYSGYFSSHTNIPKLAWADENGNIISTVGTGTPAGSTDTWSDVPIIAPPNARYACLNVSNINVARCFLSESSAVMQDDVLGSINKLAGEISSSYMTQAIEPTDITDEYFINYNGQPTSNSSFAYKTYAVDGGKIYAYSVKMSATTEMPIITWYDENMNVLRVGDIKPITPDRVHYSDVIVIAPENARFARLNGTHDRRYTVDCDVLKEVVRDTYVTEKVESLRREISSVIGLKPRQITDGYFINVDGEMISNVSYEVRDYDVEGGKEYVFNGRKGTNSGGWAFLSWYDTNGTYLGNSVFVNTAEYDNVQENVYVLSPSDAVLCRMNVMKSRREYTNIAEMVLSAQSTESGKLMKVVVSGDESFYVRTRYNDEKDIIIDHYINGNGLLSFSDTYVGDKTLTDANLMSQANRVSTHNDSTAPIRTYTQYWHLFAQHGYPVPTFANSVGMTAADVGAHWKDQLNREYVIGKVTSTTVWLLPVIYQDGDGHYTRDWHSKLTSDAITSLTYVSGGGTGHYTSRITLDTYGEEQLRSIMTHDGRTMTADGNVVQGSGVYYCDEFTASESQKGYDPATISDWFGGSGGAPDLTGASVMAEFTFSYAYKGAQCALNTTIHLLREAKGTYSAIQQQFFFDNGDYRAMFMIPKAKPRGNVELAKPFNSPSSASTTYIFNRTAEHLDNIDDPVDRQIGFLHDPNTGKYLVGMAAGLSLVSGDTVKAKRNINRPVDSRLLNFSPSNNNKFYVYATDSGVYEDGYYPAGYFKEINAYVSYFDPAENVGQVYWYKDGGRYVIYAHCQTAEAALAINVPAIMEGLHLSVLEKTDDAELLTETVQNGKIFVNYNAAGANYITLIAE